MPLLPDHLPDPMAQRSRGDAGGAGGLRLDGAACQQHVAAVKISRCLVGLMDIFAEHIIFILFYIYIYIYSSLSFFGSFILIPKKFSWTTSELWTIFMANILTTCQLHHHVNHIIIT